jgi:hypothetical protein
MSPENTKKEAEEKLVQLKVNLGEIDSEISQKKEALREVYFRRYNDLRKEIFMHWKDLDKLANVPKNKDERDNIEALIAEKEAEHKRISKELFPFEYELIQRVGDVSARTAIDQVSDKENISLFDRKLEADGKTLSMDWKVNKPSQETGMIVAYRLSGFSVRLVEGTHGEPDAKYKAFDQNGNSVGMLGGEAKSSSTYEEAFQIMLMKSEVYEKEIKAELENEKPKEKEQTGGNEVDKNKEELKKELMKLVQEGKRLEELYKQIMAEEVDEIVKIKVNKKLENKVLLDLEKGSITIISI